MKIINKPLKEIKELFETSYDELQSALLEYKAEEKKILNLTTDLNSKRYILAKRKYQNLAYKVNHYKQALNNKENGIINKKQYNEDLYYKHLGDNHYISKFILGMINLKPKFNSLLENHRVITNPILLQNYIFSSDVSINGPDYNIRLDIMKLSVYNASMINIQDTNKIFNFWLICLIYKLNSITLGDNNFDILKLLQLIKEQRSGSIYYVNEWTKFYKGCNFLNALLCLNLVQHIRPNEIVLTDLGILVTDTYLKYEKEFQSDDLYEIIINVLPKL